ncbi:MAG: prepilin-type N-terminal cleavage/methylation domain-containing protein [Verrucomicrobiota bacterium]
MKRCGFVLMEVLMAIALFSLVAVALTKALGQVGSLAVEGRRELHVMTGLQSALLEASKVQQMEEGSYLSEPDVMGVTYETTIQELELYNEDQEILGDMWLVTVRALWVENGIEREEIAEVYRYGPLYQSRL